MPQPQRRQVLKEWIDFFAEPTPIEHLTLWCRVNDELLRALRPQTQLKTLTLQWGPYTDLDVFSSFQELEQLDLGGASAITDIEPLTKLSALTHLHVENARKLRDYSPLGKLTSLRFLAVDRGVTGSRGDAESLEFVRALHSLEAFYWDPRVRSADFSPLLTLTHATEISVTPMRGQTPSMADLEWALPGMQAYTKRRAEQQITLFRDGEFAGMLRRNVVGDLEMVPAKEIDLDGGAGHA
ncbi:hypothetical protein [Microbacterium sp. NPDC056569]|uniref:hypothetical protein n=1 Tax=Microbacterium sp. NPDC056569 TaxID=3345867 RepID=UPI00366A82FA